VIGRPGSLRLVVVVAAALAFMFAIVLGIELCVEAATNAARPVSRASGGIVRTSVVHQSYVAAENKEKAPPSA
jgi:hypothetical protein